MNGVNYNFVTLLNPAIGGSGEAAFNRVEVISKFALLIKKN
ncbi:MAG TPA: hypothetical protein VJL39_03500 [Candidatus Paceibacterota bacterium]